jgi:hypothetical protein
MSRLDEINKKIQDTQKTFSELVALKDKNRLTSLTPDELTTMDMTIEVIQKYLTYLRGKAIKAADIATGGGRRRSRRHTKKNRKSRRHRK